MGISKNEFLKILNIAGDEIVKANITYKSGYEFQRALYETIKEICHRKYVTKCEATRDGILPDIIVDEYGVEAKLSNGKNWKSTGNSVTESTRVKDLKEIYIFFLRQYDGMLEYKYKKFEDCLSDIVVTHSPRYIVDMELEHGHSVFDAMNVSYSDFSKDKEKMRRVRKYLKSKVKKGQELWWLDEDKGETITPIIKDYSTLNADMKNNIIMEAYILFPEILSKTNTKYIRLAVYLLRKYQAINSHLRDMFTAGGRKSISIPGKKDADVSKVLFNLFSRAKSIKKTFSQVDLDLIEEYWNAGRLKREDLENAWLDKIDDQITGENIKPSIIYKMGLK